MKLFEAYRQNGITDYHAIRRDALDPATTPIEITEGEFYEALDMLPPVYVAGGFLMGEPVTSAPGGAVYALFAQRGERFFARFCVGNDATTHIRGDYQ